MKKLVIGLAVLFSWMGLTAAQAQVQFGVSGGSNGISNFYLAIGDYYKVPQTQVTVIRERRIPDDQIPVVLFIAQRSHRTPADVMELRSAGFSWMEVALRCGLNPEVFYVQINDARGPYGNAYGYYKKYKKNQWRRIRLNDNDIVNFVNLRFISEHYRATPDEVVVMRSKGRSFVSINDDWRMRTAPKTETRPGKNKPGRGNAYGNQNRMDKNPGPQHRGNR
jgi:hypothetical protein